MAGLYIHIPYCRNKCAYCDFFSTPNTNEMHRYVTALTDELKLRQDEISEPFTTLYLGGGTPSMLPPSYLAELVDNISRIIDTGLLKEVTIEANPEDVTPQTIESYLNTGINRVSIGVQSFNDDALEAISRRHRSDASSAALNVLHDANINYNADLIYGLPGQTPEAWKTDLMQLLSFRPPHFSAYLLSYEPGTRLYARLMAGEVIETDEDIAKKMYDTLCYIADNAGYIHYEVSNFALPGLQARHNSSYWKYAPYLGLGVAAHSFDGKTRRFNPSNIKKYIEKIEHGCTAYAIEPESERNRLNDYIITSLRTSDGFDLDFASQRFDPSLLDEFISNVTRVGTMGIERTGSHYRIPARKWLSSDAILRELILPSD